MSRPIQVLILDAFADSRQLTASILASDPNVVVVGQAGSSADLLSRLDRDQADIVLVSDPLPGEETPKAVWQITSRARQVGVIVLSARLEPEAMRRSMVAGARGFLARPPDSRELRSTIRDVYERIAEERAARARQMTPPTAPLSPQPAARAHVIAITGGKGGVGKTTIAVNLAVALRQAISKEVALVDADLALGDAGLYLDLAPAYTILDLVEVLNREPDADPDAEYIKGIMSRYAPSGLRVLLGPPRPEHAELVTPGHMDRILESLPQLFEYVVVDCPVGYDERVLTILDKADQILFVVTPEVGPLKNTRGFLDLAEALGYARDKVQIVLNRANSQVGITFEDVQRWLAYPVTHRVVSGGAAVAEAANRGRPLVLQSPQHPLSRDILALAELVRRSAAVSRQPARAL